MPTPGLSQRRFLREANEHPKEPVPGCPQPVIAAIATSPDSGKPELRRIRDPDEQVGVTRYEEPVFDY
jgi:hypothetical protein